MTVTPSLKAFAASLEGLTAAELRRQLIMERASKRLGLVWEQNSIEKDKAVNSDVVLPRLDADLSLGQGPYENLVIEGDNFDSLRLLKATHANRIRLIFIDPPYNTGANDWVYNDHFIDKKDRWRHSTWLAMLWEKRKGNSQKHWIVRNLSCGGIGTLIESRTLPDWSVVSIEITFTQTSLFALSTLLATVPWLDSLRPKKAPKMLQENRSIPQNSMEKSFF